jgi:hypothetical protein
MTGKCYYMTTLGAWQRHASRFATSHFVVLASSSDAPPSAPETAPFIDPSCVNAPPGVPTQSATAAECHDATTRILVLVEADEGVHLSLEDEPAFEALPHPLAQRPISDVAQSALAPHGVAPGATMFDAAEAVARVHPLLRHRVF